MLGQRRHCQILIGRHLQLIRATASQPSGTETGAKPRAYPHDDNSASTKNAAITAVEDHYHRGPLVTTTHCTPATLIRPTMTLPARRHNWCSGLAFHNTYVSRQLVLVRLDATIPPVCLHPSQIAKTFMSIRHLIYPQASPTYSFREKKFTA